MTVSKLFTETQRSYIGSKDIQCHPTIDVVQNSCTRRNCCSNFQTHTFSWLPEHIDTIAASNLFSDISHAQIKEILPCLGAKTRTYAADNFILHEGDTTTQVHMILSGTATIIREDWWGNRNIIANLSAADTFAESYACTSSPLSVSVVARTDTCVLSLNTRLILTGCSSACGFHAQLINNLVLAMAQNNLRLNNKLTYLSQRSTREKLVAYLSDESKRAGKANFTIPFNRQQLADYLSVNRSAMSNELCKMRDEGILSFSKSTFTLLKPF